MKQEIPQIGTKEFNDLASAYFGGKPKQETLKEYDAESDLAQDYCCKQQERMYSKEEVIQIICDFKYDSVNIGDMNPKKWFEQFKNK